MTKENLGSKSVDLFRHSIGNLIFWLSGWKIEGEIPADKKSVLILAPHTSNWDAFIMLPALFKMRIHVNWMGKKEIFFWPVKKTLIWLGGIPIDRSVKSNVVENTINIINQAEKIIIGISPEATRSKSKTWRSGFYHIANHSRIPIHFGYLDYPRKVAGFARGFVPSGDIEKDMDIIREFYKDKLYQGKFSDNVGEMKFKS